LDTVPEKGAAYDGLPRRCSRRAASAIETDSMIAVEPLGAGLAA
jgi:hypothetical protein